MRLGGRFAACTGEGGHSCEDNTGLELREPSVVADGSGRAELTAALGLLATIGLNGKIAMVAQVIACLMTLIAC